MEYVPYEYYRPGHVTKSVSKKIRNDIESIMYLEDKLLETFQSVMSVANQAPENIRSALEAIVCLGNPWNLTGDQIDNISKIGLTVPDEDDTDEEDTASGTLSKEDVDSIPGANPETKKVLKELFDSGTEIIGVPPGESMEISL